jgi:hypothetical protein
MANSKLTNFEAPHCAILFSLCHFLPIRSKYSPEVGLGSIVLSSKGGLSSAMICCYYYYYYYYLTELQMGFYPVAMVLQQDTTHKTHSTQSKVKSKAIPPNRPRGLRGCEMSRIPRCLDSDNVQTRMGQKVLLTRYHTSICIEIRSGNRTRDRQSTKNQRSNRAATDDRRRGFTDTVRGGGGQFYDHFWHY